VRDSLESEKKRRKEGRTQGHHLFKKKKKGEKRRVLKESGRLRKKGGGLQFRGFEGRTSGGDVGGRCEEAESRFCYHIA